VLSQSNLFQPNPILILSLLHLQSDASVSFFLQVFRQNCCIHLPSLPCVLHVPPISSPSLDYPNLCDENINCEVPFSFCSNKVVAKKCPNPRLCHISSLVTCHWQTACFPAVRNYLFIIVAATLHTWKPYSPAVIWQRPNYSLGLFK